MSVHNSAYNSNNGDDYVEDPVTLISRMDISDPFHLQYNDFTALTIVSIKLKGTKNYQVWFCTMLLALAGKNKIDFIDGSCKKSNTDEILGRQWDRVNVVVLGWILNSVSKELFLGQIFSKRAKHVWKELKETYDKFLMGLDDSYMHIRSSILSGEFLPDVRSDYATISSEECHIVTSGSIAGSSQWNQASVFVSNVGYPSRTQAFISKIGNFKLSNGLILYDVLVIPEYRVTLISVHKLVKENKIIVASDESRCYFLNQDLNMRNVLGIGNQCEGLYYYIIIKSNSSYSSVPGEDMNTADFPNSSGNAADSSEDIFAA
nr:ribonuclease H-like domain-containing protein [Tanacetum cinerariifolium]